MQRDVDTQAALEDQLVRVPGELHRRVKAAAALRGLSLRELLAQLITAWLESAEHEQRVS